MQKPGSNDIIIIPSSVEIKDDKPKSQFNRKTKRGQVLLLSKQNRRFQQVNIETDFSNQWIIINGNYGISSGTRFIIDSQSRIRRIT